MEVSEEVPLLNIISSYPEKVELEQNNCNKICGYLFHASAENSSQYLYCNFCQFSCTLDLVVTLVEHLEHHVFRCEHCNFKSFSRSSALLHIHTKHSKFSNYDEFSLCTLFEVEDPSKPKDKNLTFEVDEKLLDCVEESDPVHLELVEEKNSSTSSPNPVTTEIADSTSNKKATDVSYTSDIQNKSEVDTDDLQFQSLDEKIAPHLSDVNPTIENKNLSVDGGFKCLICHRIFPSVQSLCSHKRLHSRMKQFVCNMCGFRCDSRGKLFLHRKMHLFTCNICNTRFAQKSILKRHKKTKHGIVEVEDKSTFECTVCNGKFPTYRLMAAHEKTHKLVCKFCNLQCESKEILKRHMKNHIKVKKLSPCDVCGEKMPRFLIAAHRAKEHGVRPYNCEICDKTFPSRSKYNCHMFKHQEATPFLCEICGKGFTHPVALRRHMRNGHDKGECMEGPLLCSVCGKQCKNQSGLTTHMKTHNQDLSFSCEHCRISLKTEKELRQHLKDCSSRTREPENDLDDLDPPVKSKVDREPRECEVCGKKVKFLATHKARNHRKKIVYRCSVCGFRYADEHGLMRHIKLKHGVGLAKEMRDKIKSLKKEIKKTAPVEARSTCPEIPDVDDESQFEVESSFIAEKNRYKCKYCNRLFLFKNPLINHCKEQHKDRKIVVNEKRKKLTKVKEKKFKPKYERTVTRSRSKKPSVRVLHICSMCGEKFMLRAELLEHRKKHVGETPACKICGKTFSNHYQFFAHKKTHQQEQQKYKCKVCSKSYVDQASLEKHELKHTLTMLYHCKYCDSKYTRNLLRKHYSEQHKIKVNFAISNKTHQVTESVGKTPMYSGQECRMCGRWCRNLRSYRLHLKHKHKIDLATNRTIQPTAEGQNVDHKSSCKCLFCTASVNQDDLKDFYKCGYCNKICKGRSGLNSHSRHVHTGLFPKIVIVRGHSLEQVIRDENGTNDAVSNDSLHSNYHSNDTTDIKIEEADKSICNDSVKSEETKPKIKSIYICQYCDTQFISKCQLNIHCRTVHGHQEGQAEDDQLTTETCSQ